MALLAKILKSNNLLSLANNGLIAVFGLVGFMILVRSLPTNQYGAWVLFITATNFLDMLRFGITRTAIVRFLSGIDESNSKKLIGSNYLINFISTLILSIIVIAIYFLFRKSIDDSGYYLFFQWFPLVAFVTLPFNNAQSILQAKLRFDLILFLRIINVGGFMIYLIINLLYFKSDVYVIMIAYLIINVLTSLIASIFNWDGIRFITKATREKNKIIFDFGKYTTGTLIGSNLLKSADTFIIGLSPFLGTAGVALYSIPMKLTEIIEIPLRSFAMTAFPKLSKASMENNNELVKKLYYQNSGMLTLFIIPVMIISFFFAEDFVTIIGGQQYAVTAGIFQIFCLYGILLPLDRFTGVTLDAINQPKQNFIKVIYMASSNVIGDSIVVFGLYHLIHKFVESGMSYQAINVAGFTDNISLHSTVITLQMVAVVTILFTLIGIFIGYRYLNQALNLRFFNIFTESIELIKSFKGKLNRT
jgi:O-antigen/teichoic acid export membrane protein